MHQKVFGGDGVLHVIDEKNQGICGEKNPAFMVSDAEPEFFLAQDNHCPECERILKAKGCKGLDKVWVASGQLCPKCDCETLEAIEKIDGQEQVVSERCTVCRWEYDLIKKSMVEYGTRMYRCVL
jgi:hypothetical protein